MLVFDKNVKKYNVGHEILSNYDHYVTILFENIMTHSSIQVSKQAQFYILCGFCKRGTSMVNPKISIDWGSMSRRGLEGMHQIGLTTILGLSGSIQ